MPYSARWLVLLTGLLAVGVGSAYAQCFVATSGNNANNCLTPGEPCLTIQHAVDLVAAGSCPTNTVNVAAGIYTEQITIPPMTLNLIGAGAATTIISAPSPLTGNPGG
jgi:pectin methylesterase-like acyl-CoA thioesterase